LICEKSRLITGSAARGAGCATWWDVPERFGQWNSIYKRFARWAEDGTWEKLLAEVQKQSDAAGKLDCADSASATSRLASVLLDQACYVARAPPPVVLGDTERLPLADKTYDAVAALWMLYHVAEPLVVLQQAARVLRPGGSLVACTPSRYNDPEFTAVLPEWGSRSTFDAEDAAALVGQLFDVVDVERRDAPLVSLRKAADVEQFLRGRGLSLQAAREGAIAFERPMTVTKRGALVWGRIR
jgi:SAM-dependent methyltransferase